MSEIADLVIEELERLRKRIVDLEAENRQLRQHIKDLDHDLNGTIEDCNRHHGAQ